jgi:zinc/manganese transport system permease protein
MFSHEFVRNAYLAGTFVAIACGCVGWLVVLRGQLFAGDALSHVAFVGAIGAAVVGVDERVGLFVVTMAVAMAIALLGRRGEGDDAVIGTVFAWILGIGILLITMLATSSGGGTGITTANALFGFIYSLTAGQAVFAAAVGVTVAAVVLAGLRPLLLATLDPEVARVRGLPVNLLGAVVLAALAIVTAEGTQIVGALLVLGLLAAPAGAAHRLTVNPYKGLVLSAALALAAMWGGLALSYAIASLPASSAIIGVAGTIYAAASVAPRPRTRALRADA